MRQNLRITVLERDPPIFCEHSTNPHMDANIRRVGQVGGAQHIKEFRMHTNASAASGKNAGNAFEDVRSPPPLRQKPRRDEIGQRSSK
jgi:hypothetical protein